MHAANPSSRRRRRACAGSTQPSTPTSARDNACRAAGRTSALAPRERSHVAALDAWCNGDLRGAVHHWDAALDHAPLDIIALRVSQFVLSYLGESARMRVTIERALP